MRAQANAQIDENRTKNTRLVAVQFGLASLGGLDDAEPHVDEELAQQAVHLFHGWTLKFAWFVALEPEEIADKDLQVVLFLLPDFPRDSAAVQQVETANVPCGSCNGVQIAQSEQISQLAAPAKEHCRQNEGLEVLVAVGYAIFRCCVLHTGTCQGLVGAYHPSLVGHLWSCWCRQNSTDVLAVTAAGQAIPCLAALHASVAAVNTQLACELAHSVRTLQDRLLADHAGLVVFVLLVLVFLDVQLILLLHCLVLFQKLVVLGLDVKFHQLDGSRLYSSRLQLQAVDYALNGSFDLIGPDHDGIGKHAVCFLLFFKQMRRHRGAVYGSILAAGFSLHTEKNPRDKKFRATFEFCVFFYWSWFAIWKVSLASLRN
jgi:hypothetical protein